MINQLKQGSTTAFDKFYAKFKKYMKPVVAGLALNTAISVVPFPAVKIGLTVSSIAYSVYNLRKAKQNQKENLKEYAINTLIKKEELTFADDGTTLVDTRFSAEEIAKIQQFLLKEGMIYQDTGYLSLRMALNQLNYDQKYRLYQNLTGKSNSDIAKEIKKLIKPNLSERKKTLPLLGGVGGVLIDGATIGINGIGVKFLVEQLTGSTALANVTGASSAALTLPGKTFDIPILSSMIRAETAAIGYVAGIVARNVITGVHNSVNEAKSKKLARKIKKIEESKYSVVDNQEKNLILNQLNSPETQQRLSEVIFVTAVVEYMREALKVEFKEIPENIFELRRVIEKLPVITREKIGNFTKELAYYNSHKNNKVKHEIEKVLKTTGSIALLGAAGASIVNIITDGKLFEGLSAKLFPGQQLENIGETSAITMTEEKELLADTLPPGKFR